jgi:ribonuclease BN (tRNA processing enzyme)
VKVRVLGCSGAIAKDCRTTSFLLDDELLIDAGTGVGDLTLEEMIRVDNVLLTHSHLDHVAALPLMVDAIAGQRPGPLRIHALEGTIAALQTHIFNDIIWPDFTRIPSTTAPFISFHPMQVGQTLQMGNMQVEVLPAVHTVPAAGFAVSDGNGHWVFSGDTGRNPAFWQRVNQLDVRMLVMETAFSNSERELAHISLHLSPMALAEELDNITDSKGYPIYIMHTKPAQTQLIMAEIRRFDHIRPGGLAHDIRWLCAGQEFHL